MNAVKNCLVVLAAAVALASCSADPTKDQAGKNLVLTVTPAAISTRAGDTVEVFASALDPLGGAASGSFTITGGSDTTKFTATIDSTFDAVYSGTRPQQRTRIVVAALHASNGSFTVTGTGGSLNIPVRIAPDSSNGEATVSKTTLAEIDTFTVTLPAGIRVTSGFSARVYHGGLGSDSGLFSPSVVSVSPDSSAITIAVGPNNGGRVRLGGVANSVTPTLTYSMRTAAAVTSPTLDTTGTDSTTAQVGNVTLTSRVAIVNDTIKAAIGDTFVAHAPAGWRFTPGSAVDVYKGGGAADIADGIAAPQVVSVAGDSSTVTFIAAPGAIGHARITNMVLRSHPLLYHYAAVRSLQALIVPDAPFTPTFARADSNANTPVTVTMPANFKFTPTSTLSVDNQELPPVPYSIAADSNSGVFLLPPNSQGLVTIDHVIYTPQAFFDATVTSTNKSPRVNGAANLGSDGGTNPLADAGVFHYTVPSGQVTSGFFDQLTFGALADDPAIQFSPIGDGNEQWYKITFADAGPFTLTVDWTLTGDLDFFVFDGSGNFLSEDGATSSQPESDGSNTATAGQTFLVDVTNSSGTVRGDVGMYITRP